jgi:hypothetical protein
MTYRTHLYLADLILPPIEELWGIRLSRKRFRAGSVKPDTTSLFVRHPHFWGLSRKYVEKRILRLARTELAQDAKNGRFSEELGIVLHYVADFFTSVHNVRPNPIARHLASEEALHEAFLAHVGPDSVMTSFRLILGTGMRRLRKETADLAADRDGNGSGRKRRDEPIVRALRDLHGRFVPDGENAIHDVREILVACLTVTAFVMESAASRTRAGQGSVSRYATASTEPN